MKLDHMHGVINCTLMKLKIFDCHKQYEVWCNI